MSTLRLIWLSKIDYSKCIWHKEVTSERNASSHQTNFEGTCYTTKTLYKRKSIF